MDEKQIGLLKRLTEAFGPPGFERDVAAIVRAEMEPLADSCRINRLGSVIFQREGRSSQPRILVAGHMDEVGFCITGIHKETGFLKFHPLGGWFDQVLLSQRVLVRTSKGDVPGVIAATPPHLIPEEERKKVVKKDDMYIDIGTSSKEETEATGVRLGDPVVPWSPFTLIRDGRIAVGKAFDDRAGTFAAMEVLRRLVERKASHPNHFIGAATTQEEVGLRGAKTVAFETNPDVCFVAEVDISGDVPGTDDKVAPAKMGKGVSIVTYDSSMIPNQPLKEFVIEVAEETGIPHQLSIVSRGGTDAGAIHITNAGCPSIVLGVPTRHIHSHTGMMALSDLEAMVDLITECITRLDEKKVESFTSA